MTSIGKSPILRTVQRVHSLEHALGSVNSFNRSVSRSEAAAGLRDMNTNYRQSEFDSDHFVKFADDTVIVSLLRVAEKAHCPLLFFNGAVKPFQNCMKQFLDVTTLLP